MDEVTPLATPEAEPTISIGNVEVPISEVISHYEFGKALRSGGYVPPAAPPVAAPSVGAQPVQGAVEPQPPVPPSSGMAPPLPEWVDAEDPFQVGMFRQQQSLAAEMAKSKDALVESNKAIAQQHATANFNIALSNFRTQYPDLTEGDLALIRPHASTMVNALISADPDNVPGAMQKAMYIASLEIESTRSKVLPKATADSATRSQHRKQKLSALGGSGGSSPRTPTRPALTNDRQAVDAFAKELAESFGANGRL